MGGSETVDASVLKKLPQVTTVLEVSSHGASAWASTFRIFAQHHGGQEESYFLKVSTGHHGRESLKGEYESTSAIHAITPDFVPTPIAYGTYETDPNSHFYLAAFRSLEAELPEPNQFCEKLARLHTDGVSHNGKFGFHVVTYNGDLPQDNTYTNSWEEFFINGLKHMLALNVERGGHCTELEALAPAMLEKVIPRLLRPLETGGNKIKPALVHGDLWCGNAAIDLDTDMPIVFDPCCFWAHNEYELGNWRPKRNMFSPAYFSTYHKHYPKAYPEADYDDRNALYGLRFNLQAASLFPEIKEFRDSVIEEMKRLIEKYPGGYEDYIGDQDQGRRTDGQIPDDEQMRAVGPMQIDSHMHTNRQTQLDAQIETTHLISGIGR